MRLAHLPQRDPNDIFLDAFRDLPHDEDLNRVRLRSVSLEQSRHGRYLVHAANLADAVKPRLGPRRQLRAHNDALIHPLT